jgi:integrase
VTIRKRKWVNKKTCEEKAGWQVDWFDHGGKRHRRQFDTKREAEAHRDEVANQLRTGTFRPDAMRMTIADFAPRYLEHLRGRCQRGERMTRGTLQFIEGNLYRTVLATPDTPLAKNPRYPGRNRIAFYEGIGHVKLAHLTTRVVGELRDRLRNAGMTVPTTRKALSVLSGMLEYARSQDVIAVNPAHGVEVIGPRNEGAKRVTPPSKDTLKLIMANADPAIRLPMALAAATGARAGELWALRWRHVNFDLCEVKIETRVDKWRREDGQGTKSLAGNRTVPLGKDILDALKAVRERSPYSADSDLIFANARGGGYRGHCNEMNRHFRPIFKRLADKHGDDPASNPPPPPYFNWHALRHFAISCWIESGLSPKVVQTLAGHSALQVTMDRYGHMFKSEDHRLVMDKIASGLFSSNDLAESAQVVRPWKTSKTDRET